MRTPLKSIAKAALARPLSILFILIIGGIGVQTITSCSGGDDGGDNNGGSSPSNGNNSSSSGAGNGGGGDRGTTRAIKNVTNSSFTIVHRDDYECQEDGTLKNTPYEEEARYSINGTTASLGGRIDFNGNPSSPNRPYGTWTREPYSASCNENDWICKDLDKISKVVITETSITITTCFGKIGEERESDYGVKRKYIDCDTYEETKGTEMVRTKYSKAEFTATYNGKTCTSPLFDGGYYHSESQMQKACKEAHDNNGDYNEILDKDLIKCLKDKNFPVWWSPN